jgi:hypothetical protein
MARSRAGSAPGSGELRAALEVLADQGLPGFTMEAIA